MSASTATVSTLDLWSEEPSARPDRRKIRARIGGLHCSLCTGTIEKALGRMPGVDKVAVSLTHEQALVEYDPAVARPEQLLQTLRDIGYTISDPRKLRAFEEEERDLVREARRFVLAVVLSVAAIPIIADPAVGWTHFGSSPSPNAPEGHFGNFRLSARPPFPLSLSGLLRIAPRPYAVVEVLGAEQVATFLKRAPGRWPSRL